MHPALALAGFGIGCATVAFGRWRGRIAPGADQGPLAALLVVAVVVALLVAGQIPPAAVVPLLVLPWAAWFAGGLAPHARIGSLDASVAALAAVAVLAAVLPDTEGPVVLGAALVPLVVAAVVDPVAWRGSGALMATTALAVGVVVVAVDASADRSGALAVALVASVVCAALTVVGVRLALGDRLVAADDHPVTSGRGRPSR